MWCILVKQVVVLRRITTASPAPRLERNSLHWRRKRVCKDPGGCWPCLRPVYHAKWIHPATRECVVQTSGFVVKQVVFLTVNHRGPLPLREIHSTGETRVWRDPGGSWACLLPVYKWNHLPKAVTQSSGVVVKQVVFLTVNHRGPLPLTELHSTDETRVWRDPGGSWACLLPAYDYEWIQPAKGSDTMWPMRELIPQQRPEHHTWRKRWLKHHARRPNTRHSFKWRLVILAFKNR